MTKPILCKYFFLLLCTAIQSTTSAQGIVASEGSFGIDKDTKIIVWHVSNLDSLLSRNNEIANLTFGQEYIVVEQPEPLSYHRPNRLKYENENYRLYITRLPVVHITINPNTINNRTKKPGYFTYYNSKTYVESSMGVRHRGNLSLTFPKKSYSLQFWTDSISKQSKNLRFKNLRSDDDWILDGLYNEPLRLRSFISTRLWKKIHKPYYSDIEPKAKSGFEFTFVEVFKNRKYIGIYALSEPVDPKQLALKKADGKRVLGELFKAESYEGAPDFKKAPVFNNLFPHWGGFRMEYPLIEYRAHWNDLAKLVELTVKASDEEFVRNIEKQLRLKNTIDYYLFVNLLRATDNLGKNYYLGRYDENEPYFFVPWDLDGVFGTIQDGKRIPTTDDILANNLFKRLMETNPNGYVDKVKLRWKKLRAEVVSDVALQEMVDKDYHSFLADKIYERERIVWPDSIAAENHYGYLKKWMRERLLFLDAYFDGLE